MLRAALLAGLSLLLVFLAVQMWYFYDRGVVGERALADVQAELQKVRSENAALKDDLEYYQHPENLEKELRARFNYRAAGEKMIVLIPPRSASDTTTSTQP